MKLSLPIVSALLPGLPPSHAVGSAAPTGFIPSIQAKVVSLRFFESPRHPYILPREQRVYGNRFVRSRARHIYWQLDLTHPAPRRPVTLTVESVWFSPTGGDRGFRRTMQARIEGDWIRSFWHAGVRLVERSKLVSPDGQRRVKEEAWPAGHYRVDIHVAGALVASGSFEVIEDGSAQGRSTPSGDSAAKRAARAAYEEADRLADKLKFREAIEQLDKALALDPDLLSAYALRGYSYNVVAIMENKREYRLRAIGDYSAAIERGLKNGVRDARWHNGRGAIYMSLDENQRALRDFNEALQIDPRYVTAVSNRGELRRKIGDLDGSVADLTRLIELEPKVGQRYCQRGLTWLKGRKDAEAEADFRRCSELDSKARKEYTSYIDKMLAERKRRH